MRFVPGGQKQGVGGQDWRPGAVNEGMTQRQPEIILSSVVGFLNQAYDEMQICRRGNKEGKR